MCGQTDASGGGGEGGAFAREAWSSASLRSASSTLTGDGSDRDGARLFAKSGSGASGTEVLFELLLRRFPKSESAVTGSSDEGESSETLLQSGPELAVRVSSDGRRPVCGESVAAKTSRTAKTG